MQTARQYEVKPPNEEETVLLTRNPFLDEYVRYEKLGVAEIHKCGFVIGKSNTLDRKKRGNLENDESAKTAESSESGESSDDEEEVEAD